MSAHPALSAPYHSDSLDLQHRIVLAPMTRIRADDNTLAASDLTAEYYRQRASPGGLLISEAIHISPEATPIWHIYPQVKARGGQVPGLWTETQTASWRKVVQAVHQRGGVMACQLLHTGRIAQPDIAEHPLVKGKNLPLPPVSSSAVPIAALDETGNDYNWDCDSVCPRALDTNEITRIIRDYQHAAENALQAGFDYVELHAAHGYLVEQFLCDGVNQRTDRYGGSLENRCRFLLELVEALLETCGDGKIAVRLSPIQNDPATGTPNQIYFGVTCSDPVSLYSYAVSALNRFPLAYLLLTEPRVGALADDSATGLPLGNTYLRDICQHTLMGAGGFTPKTAERAVTDGIYDLIAFGRRFLANPDLPMRIAHGLPLNAYNRDRFYGGGAEGYTDYPTCQP